MSRVRSRSGKATAVDRLCWSIRKTYKALSPKGREKADREITKALRGESSLGGLDPGAGWRKFGSLSRGRQENLSPRRNRTNPVPKLAHISELD